MLQTAFNRCGQEFIMVVRTALVRVTGALTGTRYRDETHHGHVISHVTINGGMFQRDNDRPHIARVNQEFIQRHNVQTLILATHSPNSNAVEYLRGAPEESTTTHTLPQLLTALQHERQNIAQCVEERLIASMRRRRQAGTRARGEILRFWPPLCHTHGCVHVSGGFLDILFRT